jgi:hypothetical protein
LRRAASKLAVEEAAVVVELLGGMRHSELTVDHPGADRAQHLASFRLSPHAAEHPRDRERAHWCADLWSANDLITDRDWPGSKLSVRWMFRLWQ